ncbi:MAG: DUF502 domain-containing protein [Vicingaceae bacterium]|jgi:uncharacterized membrane protein|tara:strand:+ start:6347 stop:6952 length:606 start_codon:yes stop_codon:yes gene_type:complete
MREVGNDKRFFKTLVKYFLQGLFYVVPISVTVYLIVWLVVKIDGIINLDIPGLGLIAILIGITLIGFLGSHFFVSYLRPLDRAMEKTPLIKLVYTSMKDLMNAFVGKKKQFKTPVLVKMGEGLEVERMGFITKGDLSEMGISKDKVAVYFPFSYGINGQVMIIPKKNISIIHASSSDVMKFIVSGGVTNVESTEKQNNKTA